MNIERDIRKRLIDICPLCESPLDYDEQYIIKFQEVGFHHQCIKEVNGWILNVKRMASFNIEHRKSFYQELKTLKTLYSHPFMQELLDALIEKAEKSLN